MSKYWVSAVRYNAQETHIEYVREHCETIGAGTATVRATVISRINCGASYATVYAKDGKWTVGEDIRVVPVGGTEYLRTDGNTKAADNLGNLPRF